jgi:SAM-dependent methyltransferase
MIQCACNSHNLARSRSEDYEKMNLDVVQRRWDRRSERWEAELDDARCHLHADDAYRRFITAASRIIAARSAFCSCRLLVDLGCGTGLVLERFISHFAAGLGIDISEKMLQIARGKNLAAAEYRQQNAFELAGTVSCAGAILSRGIFLSHYGFRWAPVLLKQIHQSLAADGGFALLDFLNADSRGLYPCNPPNKTYFNPIQIAAMGRRTGFRRCRILGKPTRRVLLALLER